MVRTVDAVYDVLQTGRSVLFHCMAGIHRAPMCAAGVIAALFDESFGEAYERVRASGRYVEPREFVKRVGDECMRKILTAAARVQAAVRGESPVSSVEAPPSPSPLPPPPPPPALPRFCLFYTSDAADDS